MLASSAKLSAYVPRWNSVASSRGRRNNTDSKTNAAQQLVAADLLIDSLFVAGLGQVSRLVSVAPSFHPQVAELGVVSPHIQSKWHVLSQVKGPALQFCWPFFVACPGSQARAVQGVTHSGHLVRKTL